MANLTDLSYVRSLCRKYGFSLSRGFGQNFIVNPGVCPKICDAADIGEKDTVLEIGPGFGMLTQQLARRAKKVIAVEVDTRLLPVLQETLAEYPNAQVVLGDALTCDFQTLLQKALQSGPVKVCANLPYYITSPVLMRLLEEKIPFESITVMVQKEAAERIAAKPGTREAGAISYAVWYYAVPKVQFSVKPGSFYPPPKVTSSVIRLALRAEQPLAGSPEREKRLFKLVRAAFGQRRKTFANAVSNGLGIAKEALGKALAENELPPLVRPEQLTLEDYMALEKALWP